MTLTLKLPSHNVENLKHSFIFMVRSKVHTNPERLSTENGPSRKCSHLRVSEKKKLKTEVLKKALLPSVIVAIINYRWKLIELNVIVVFLNFFVVMWITEQLKRFQREPNFLGVVNGAWNVKWQMMCLSVLPNKPRAATALYGKVVTNRCNNIEHKYNFLYVVFNHH